MENRVNGSLLNCGLLVLGVSLCQIMAVRAEEVVGTEGMAPVASENVSVTSAENVSALFSGPGSVMIVPASSTYVSNCIPFGNNTTYGFTGFIYRDVPAFNMPVGAKIRFDLGALNDVDIRRNIFFGTANINPAPVPYMYNVVSQSITVDANGWTQVVLDAQVPLNSKGNTISGDYELTYTAEAPFTFAGGGFLIGFQGSPPAAYQDFGCQQVLVRTDGGDNSGNFYARFFRRPDLSLGVLDSGGGGTGLELGGFILDDLFIEVAIDVKPGSDPNSINLCSNGVVPVAILGSDTFYANDIDPDTLRFADASVKMVGKKDPNTLCSLEDVNGDGFDDLVCNFITYDIALLDGDSTTVDVNGELFDGTPIKGSDSVNIVKDICD